MAPPSLSIQWNSMEFNGIQWKLGHFESMQRCLVASGLLRAVWNYYFDCYYDSTFFILLGVDGLTDALGSQRASSPG